MREETSRMASVVIGGIGTLVGMAKGLVVLAGTLLFELLLARAHGSEFVAYPSYPFLAWGSEGMTVTFCALGMIGVVLVALGRLRVGALLMVICAVGVAASVAAYVLLLPSAMAPAEPVYPKASSYGIWLAPVPLLLAGAVLAVFAYRTEG
jgi:hypothetical protein